MMFAALLCVMTGLFSSCGKRRPPLPPLENIPQQTELLSGVQRGNQVVLSWPAPRRNAPATSVQSIRRIDIYRLEEPTNRPLPLTEEEFAASANLIGSVTAEEIERAGDTLSYIDTLELSDPVRLRYALRYVNAANQRAAFSNFHLIEPATSISQPPVLTEIIPAEDTITIRWQPASANIDSSTPPNILGYNIYRLIGAQKELAQTPLNSSTLIDGTEYLDQTFRFGKDYTYIVRAVSLGTNGTQVESLNSNPKSITPRDTFRPSAPEKISIAPGPGRLLTLFFPLNPERDVVGYNVYRSLDPDLPKEHWTKLTRQPLPRNTYHDELVEPGVRYYYYLTAVDAAGNVSRPSEVVTEVSP